MVQENILFIFKKKADEYKVQEALQEKSEYNLIKGFWENEEGSPYIQRLLLGKNSSCFGTTLLTETRESIDRSEGS